jgi:hypothetical protein
VLLTREQEIANRIAYPIRRRKVVIARAHPLLYSASAFITPVPGTGAWSKVRVVLRTREIYRSANGDRWLLALDSDTDLGVRQARAKSSLRWAIADIEIGAYGK